MVADSIGISQKSGRAGPEAEVAAYLSKKVQVCGNITSRDGHIEHPQDQGADVIFAQMVDLANWG